MMRPEDSLPTQVLSREQWEPLQAAHQQRAERLTGAHMGRRKAGEKHPVFDFLFEYYPVRVAHLYRWHPGPGIGLIDAPEHASWKGYRTDSGVSNVDVAGLWEKRGQSFRFIHSLLSSTNSNPAHFDCFGLHEWAMVYQGTPRHDLPLRLGAEGSDAVVESHQIRCTHYDAYRFFTPAARPRNQNLLSRETQPAHDQRGCVHATMDLYKWASKLGPLVPGELWLDTFELARDARVLDMEASPYDCTGLGFGVVAIETPQGKAEYVERQRALAERGTALRARLVALLEATAPTRLDV